jgi:uncharacterized protein (DUF2344 family)
MIRVVISLAQEDKNWLQHIAEDQHQSMAEVIRQAIERYRLELQTTSPLSLEQILSKTKGIWKQGDALAYQRKIRSEWDKK